jgi:hypothetical protein
MNSPLGVCVLPPPARNMARTVSYPHYIHEILSHAGLCYESIPPESLRERLAGLRLLVTVGEGALSEDVRTALQTWVEQGGAWIGIGGVCGLASLFGVEVEPPAYSTWGGGMGTLGEGYLAAYQASHPVLVHLRMPLHFFNGISVQSPANTAQAYALDAHGTRTPRAAVVERSVGQGRCLLLAPDITGAVVRIQQGIAVTRDGVSAPDGTAPIADDVLKSGDGGVLDWILDREPVPNAPGCRAFLQPIADQWREMLVRAILTMAEQQGISLPLLWLYPRSLPALLHLSHDTDGNDPALAQRLLEILRTAGVRSTWCTILPGYPPDLMSAIANDGHEFAMHYDAMSEGTVWSEGEFEMQWWQLTALFDGHAPVTNKNHYLRWEGDIELFEWCARRGIQLDQSKGASKTGEAGFNFGTCHPHFPVAFDGKVLDVLELTTPTQDLEVFAPQALLNPLLEAVERHHGILHLLFHPAHIGKQAVADALLAAVAAAKQRGMEVWTAQQIDAWERARRSVRWTGYGQEAHKEEFSLRVETPLPEATLLWLLPRPGRITLNGEARAVEAIARWGFAFQSVVCDLEPDTEITMTVTQP